MKVASKILLIVGGALALWAVASSLWSLFSPLAWPAMLINLLAGIFALVACGVKKRGSLVVALVFGYLRGSWFIIIGAILGLIYVCIQGYKNEDGSFNRTKMRMVGEIILYIAGLMALASALTYAYTAVMLLTFGVGASVFYALFYAGYTFLAPGLGSIDWEAIAAGTLPIEEAFAIFSNQSYIDKWVETITMDPTIYIFIIDIVVFIIVGINLLIQALFTFILSIIAMKAGNGKEHGKGIYIAVIVFAVFTLAILPLVGAILALIATAKEQKQAKQQEELQALPMNA